MGWPKLLPERGQECSPGGRLGAAPGLLVTTHGCPKIWTPPATGEGTVQPPWTWRGRKTPGLEGTRPGSQGGKPQMPEAILADLGSPERPFALTCWCRFCHLSFHASLKPQGMRLLTFCPSSFNTSNLNIPTSKQHLCTLHKRKGSQLPVTQKLVTCSWCVLWSMPPPRPAPQLSPQETSRSATSRQEVWWGRRLISARHECLHVCFKFFFLKKANTWLCRHQKQT